MDHGAAWAAAPAPRLAWLAAGTGLLACLTVWAPAAPQWAAAAGAVLVAVASFDLLRSWREGTPAHGSVVGDDGGTLPRLRLTQGRPQRLRIGLEWRGSAGREAVRMALLAASARFEQAVSLPLGSFAVRSQGGPREGWEGMVTGRERGQFQGLRLGLEQGSRWGLWRMRHWQTLACEFAVYPDLAPGRKALMRSRVFRALAASAWVPLTGRGREFEKLREYQAGDTYADLSWKATARRAYPVTRLFQWEQQQEIYFVVDHGRRSRLSTALGRSQLERYIETALVGASAAMEVGDRFGLISFAGEVDQWLGAGSGRAHFAACRERLLGLEATSATPNYEGLFAAIRTRLRRRCYLLLLTDATERGLAEALADAARLARQTHLIMIASLLPPEARPLGHGAPAAGTEGVYRALAEELELRRMEALRPRLWQAGLQFRAVAEGQYLPTAIDGYLQNKREQRL